MERMVPGSEDNNTQDFFVDHALIYAYKDYHRAMKLRLLAERICDSKVEIDW